MGKKTKPAAVGRPPKGEVAKVLARIPPAVLEGVDRKAAAQKLSRNDALIRACLDYGDFPDGRPVIKPEKRSIGAKVKTAEPPPITPGARLDKRTIGRRTGPPIRKAPIGQPVPESV